MQRLRRDSDARFRVKVRDGNGVQIDPRGVDLTIQLCTSRSECYRVLLRRQWTLPAGVALDGNDILLSVDCRPFPTGRMYAKVEMRIPNTSYPDGSCDVNSGEILTNIIVVK